MDFVFDFWFLKKLNHKESTMPEADDVDTPDEVGHFDIVGKHI